MLLITLPASPLAAQGVHYEGGFSYASGRYGGSETLTQLVLNNGASVSRGAWTLRATVPLYMQNNTVIVTTGGGRVSGGGRQAASASVAAQDTSRRGSGIGGGAGEESLAGYETGLGDPVASISAALPVGFPYAASATASVKFPVAESAFSTGEWDAGVSVDASRWLGRQLLSVGAAWWYVGDVPGYGLLSPWLGSVVVTRPGIGSGALSLGAYVSSATQEGLDPVASAWIGYARDVGLARMIASVGAGFTSATPAFTASLGWRIALAD